MWNNVGLVFEWRDVFLEIKDRADTRVREQREMSKGEYMILHVERR